MKVDQRFLWGFVLLLLFPDFTQANSGTPLMIAKAIHLVYGNFLIGILEGLILSLAFGAKWWKSILVMIVGNYFTAWLGMAVLKNSDGSLFLTIDNFVSKFFILVLIAYLMTLVFEFPFVYFALKPGEGRIRQAVWGSGIIQTVSYFLLLAWYACITDCSLMVDTRVVALSELPIESPVLVCFISEKGDEVYQGVLGTGDWEKIGQLRKDRSMRRLILRKSLNQPEQVDLFCAKWFNDGLMSGEMVKEKFADIKKTAWLDLGKNGKNKPILEWQNESQAFFWSHGVVAKLGEAPNSEWDLENEDWGTGRLIGMNNKSGDTINFAMVNPIVNWIGTNATQIPGDLVLFQLGENQICLYDPNTKRIALVARGKGPVAVLR